MNSLITFLENEKHSRKAKFVGFIAALTALFVSIAPPDNIDARNALAVIQLFWLVLLTLGLTSLFFDFLKYVWKKEREMSRKYELPFNFIITITLGAILGAVVLNLWRYILSLYPYIVADFTIIIGFPSFVTIWCIFVAILIKKNEEKIAPIFQALADSVIVGVLIGVGGLYLHQAITKLFYPFWLTRVALIVAIAFFCIAIGAMLYRKVKLWG